MPEVPHAQAQGDRPQQASRQEAQPQEVQCCENEEAVEDKPRRGHWALGAVGAMLVCCVGHSLLLALGLTGLGAALAALTATRVGLISAGIAVAVIAALITVRLRRPASTGAATAARDVIASSRQGISMSPTTDLARRMAAAGLPVDNLTLRRAQLPVPIQQLHGRILAAIAGTGQNPSAAQVQQWATSLGVQAADALRALADAELLFLNDTAGPAESAGAAGLALPAVRGGVPFSDGGSSAHRVQIAGGPEVAANCAVDALGISAMLGTDTQVHSRDPLTGDVITATSNDEHWTWQPATAVVFVGSNGSGKPLTQSCCPVINFFTDEANARIYQQRHHLQGEVLSMSEATEAGALVFGDLLREPTVAP